MKNAYTQIDLFSKRNEIRIKTKPITFGEKSKTYLRNLYTSQKKQIVILFSLIFLISLIEVTIPILFRFYIEKFSFRLDIKGLYLGSAVVVFLLLVYIVLTYFSIIKQKQIILNVVNKIREDYIRIYLQKNMFQLKEKDKSKLFVKISYHLSLLQLGLQNSFFVFFQWLFFMGGIVIVSAILDFKMLVLSLILFPVHLIVFYLGYVFSSYYLSKDQTLYSKLLQYVIDVFNSFSLIKTLKKEQDVLSNIQNIVEIDNHFRIKREVVLQLGNKLIFTVLTLLSVLAYIIHIYTPINIFDSALHSAVFALMLALQIKLLHLSLRIGLFYFPLKLGLFLSIPSGSGTVRNIEPQSFAKIDQFVMKTEKRKNRSGEGYQRDVRFTFEKGKSYIIKDEDNLNNDNILHVCAGVASYTRGKSWVFKVNLKQRTVYREWCTANISMHYIHPYLYTETTLFEFLNQHPDIELLKKFKVFDFIFKYRKFIGTQINKENLSFKRLCLLQIAYCLIHKPNIVFVDPSIHDLVYSDIKQALEILKTHMHDSIYVASTYVADNTKNYDVVYTI